MPTWTHVRARQLNFYSYTNIELKSRMSNNAAANNKNRKLYDKNHLHCSIACFKRIRTFFYEMCSDKSTILRMVHIKLAVHEVMRMNWIRFKLVNNKSYWFPLLIGQTNSWIFNDFPLFYWKEQPYAYSKYLWSSSQSLLLPCPVILNRDIACRTA